MTKNTAHVLVLALRLVFAFLVASASGLAMFFLLLATLPDPPSGTRPDPYPINASAPVPPMGYDDYPSQRAKARHLAMALGVAFLNGAVWLVITFVASKRWFPLAPVDLDDGHLPPPPETP